jgi:hypothetical protein
MYGLNKTAEFNPCGLGINIEGRLVKWDNFAFEHIVHSVLDVINVISRLVIKSAFKKLFIVIPFKIF